MTVHQGIDKCLLRPSIIMHGRLSIPLGVSFLWCGHVTARPRPQRFDTKYVIPTFCLRLPNRLRGYLLVSQVALHKTEKSVSSYCTSYHFFCARRAVGMTSC